MGSLWNRSSTVERFADDIRAAGAQAFFYDGGTTTPLTVFRDAGEGSAFPNPVVADAHGRWPDVFVPYIVGYDVRVLTAENVQLTFTQQIPNPDPVNVTVTGSSDNSIQTGMIHAELVNTVKAGYVRLNGRTVGNASSGATERANADTSALFSYLWNNLADDVATVSPARGSSASSDYAANKNISLPDMRGFAFIGLDDMGNLPSGNFGGLVNELDGGDFTRAGVFGGVDELFMTADQMAPHSHVGGTSSTGAHVHNVEVDGTTSPADTDHTHDWGGGFTTGSGAHAHNYATPGTASISASGGGTGISVAALTNTGTTSPESPPHTHSVSVGGTTSGMSTNHEHTLDAIGVTDEQGIHSHILATNTVGGGASIPNMPYSRTVTWFIKL